MGDGGGGRNGIAVFVGPFIKDRWTLPWTPTGTGTTTTLLAFIIAIGALLLFRRRLENIDKQAGAKSTACYPQRQVGG